MKISRSTLEIYVIHLVTMLSGLLEGSLLININIVWYMSDVDLIKVGKNANKQKKNIMGLEHKG